ncbi:DUF1836 domain-containing protein [bacterium]|nr:DUF1836 domain-containing protein [bacterium]
MDIPFIHSEIAKKLANFKLPRYDEIVSYPVAMRQLIAILENYLNIFKDPFEEEKPLTPFMINSYVRKKVIEPPEGKDYNKKHIMFLIVIGILKQVLSISDIGKILKMAINQYPPETAYNYFCNEVEGVLNATFATRSSFKNSPKVITPLNESVHSAVIAFANKIYVKQYLYFTEQVCV